jgi:hypothetical protein
MSLETVRQKALLIVALTVVVMGFGIAILLASEVLLSVVVILPFLAALCLVRIYHLSLTRQCLASYLQMRKPLKR